MIIVGIRPGLDKSNFAWCVLNQEGVVINRGRIPGSKIDIGKRLMNIKKTMITVFDTIKDKDCTVFFDQKLGSLNPEPLYSLAEARGVVKLLAGEYGFKILNLKPEEIENTLKASTFDGMASVIHQKTGIRLIDNSSIKAFALAIVGWHMLQKPDKKPAKEVYQEGSYGSTYGLKWSKNE